MITECRRLCRRTLIIVFLLALATTARAVESNTSLPTLTISYTGGTVEVCTSLDSDNGPGGIILGNNSQISEEHERLYVVFRAPQGCELVEARCTIAEREMAVEPEQRSGQVWVWSVEREEITGDMDVSAVFCPTLL